MVLCQRISLGGGSRYGGFVSVLHCTAKQTHKAHLLACTLNHISDL